MEKFAFEAIRRILGDFGGRFYEKICGLGEIRKIICDFINAPHFKRTLLWGVALYLIALFALLRGDIYYADDLNRAVSDYGGDYYNRYFTEFILTKVLTFGKGTMDISPLPQILGVIFIVISAMILLYLIRKKFDFIGVLASLPLGLSPHFLQNLSYKFDSVTMGIALFLAVLPFLFFAQRRVFCAVSVVCLILMFMTYQAANATYIILSLYFALFLHADFKQGARFLGVCALNLIIASLLYKLTINPAGASDRAFAIDMLFAGILQNLLTYFATIFSDLKNTPFIYLIALNCALFAINAMLCKGRRIYAFFRAILFLALGFCASYGLYAVLEMPLFHPRAYYGLNALIAVICIANISQFAESAESNAKSVADSAESGADSTKSGADSIAESAESNADSTAESTAESTTDSTKLSKILRPLSFASIAITAYFLISFANIYGNALKKQDEYLSFRAEMLLQYLGEKIPRGASVVIDIGAMGNAVVTQRFYDKYGDARIIPRLSSRGDFWFEMKLRHLGVKHNFGDAEICDMLKAQFGSEVVAQNAHHTIEKAKACYFVTMH